MFQSLLPLATLGHIGCRYVRTSPPLGAGGYLYSMSAGRFMNTQSYPTPRRKHVAVLISGISRPSALWVEAETRALEAMAAVELYHNDETVGVADNILRRREPNQGTSAWIEGRKKPKSDESFHSTHLRIEKKRLRGSERCSLPLIVYRQLILPTLPDEWAARIMMPPELSAATNAGLGKDEQDVVNAQITWFRLERFMPITLQTAALADRIARHRRHICYPYLIDGILVICPELEREDYTPLLERPSLAGVDLWIAPTQSDLSMPRPAVGRRAQFAR